MLIVRFGFILLNSMCYKDIQYFLNCKTSHAKLVSLPYFLKDNKEKVEEILTNKQTQQSLYWKIEDVEEKIRQNKAYETAVVFDLDGNIVIDKRGQQYSVSFTKEECNKMKDCIVTHNHPRGWGFKENEIGRMGNSFSFEDIQLAVSNDLLEIRAVTPLYTFVLERPKEGWGILVSDLKSLYIRTKKEVDGIMLAYLDKFEYANTQVNRANAIAFHFINRKLASKLGWKYSKKKR